MIALSRLPDIYERFAASIAPSIYGFNGMSHNHVAAVLLSSSSSCHFPPPPSKHTRCCPDASLGA